MKKHVMWIALLAMMTLLLGGLAGCGGGSSAPAESADSADSNVVTGNWYTVVLGEVETIKLDAEGGGSWSGKAVTYELDGESLSLHYGSYDEELTVAEDETGQVLKDGDHIFAYRDKKAAQAVADDAMTQEGPEESNGDSSSSSDSDSSSDSGDSSGSSDSNSSSDSSSASSSSSSANNAKAKDYIGTWEGESVDYQGNSFTLEDIGMTFSVEITESGSMLATTNGESDGAANWTLNDDGTLAIKDANGDLPAPAYIDDNGKLHVALDADGDTMWFVLHKK